MQNKRKLSLEILDEFVVRGNEFAGVLFSEGDVEAVIIADCRSRGAEDTTSVQ